MSKGSAGFTNTAEAFAPSTNVTATPIPQAPNLDEHHTVQPSKVIEDFQTKRIANPPKLKLKLRNLASKPAIASSSLGVRMAPNTHYKDTRSSSTSPSTVQFLEWMSSTPATRQETPLTEVATKSGSANNPIDVDTLKTPPPYKNLNKLTGYCEPPPHKYRPLRPKPAPRLVTPNGATIQLKNDTRHQSHAIYKELAARKAIRSPPGFAKVTPRAAPATASGFATYVGGPKSHYVYNQQQANASASHQRLPGQGSQQGYEHVPHPNTTILYTPGITYPIFPTHDEKLLRSCAHEVIVDHTRSRPRKHHLSGGSDEESSSEYEGPRRPQKRKRVMKSQSDKAKNGFKVQNSEREDHHKTSKTPALTRCSTPSTGASEENIFDRKVRLKEMFDHTQLLASLLATYPHSVDQKGLREDIAMLASVANKRLELWLSAENRLDSDSRRCRQDSPIPSPGARVSRDAEYTAQQRQKGGATVLTDEMARARKHKEEKEDRNAEIRQYLSSESTFWAKGTRDGVASKSPKALQRAISEPSAFEKNGVAIDQ